MALVDDTGLRSPQYTKLEVRMLFRSEVALPISALVDVVTLPFDL